MGDILHALPAVTALRAAHPEWVLGWAVEPQWRALLAADTVAGSELTGPGREVAAGSARSQAMPLVDRIHLIPAKQWGRAPLAPQTVKQVLSARRQLRAAGYDVALDLQGAVRSAMVARWSRATRILGEAAPREPLARRLFTELVPTRGVHVIEQAGEVAGVLVQSSLPLDLPLLPRDERAEAWARAHVPPQDFVLLSPGAGWGAKRWPLERYAAVARGLAARGMGVVVNASPSERALGEALAQQSGAMVLEPALGQLLAVLRRASLAVAGDTGPLHLAAALGVPTVGIFGPTDPLRNGPFHGDFLVLRHPDSRRDHTRRQEPEAGLLTITADEVLAAAERLLARRAAAVHAGPVHPVSAGGAF